MVKVFFVISGFALSVKAAEYITSPHSAMGSAQLHQHVAMSILKRAVRLFLPPVVTTFCAMCLAYAGAFMTRREIMELPTGLVYFGIVRRQTFSLQLLDWVKFVTCRLMNPWVWLDRGWHLGHAEKMDDFSIYGPHLWTIQTEFRCSMVLFLVLIAMSRIPQRRLQELLLLSIVIYCATWGRWDVALFISGMLCCLVSARQHVGLPGAEIFPNNGLQTEIEASQVPSPHAVPNTNLGLDQYNIEASSEDNHEDPVNEVHWLDSSWWGRGKLPLSIRTFPRQRWFYRLTFSSPTNLSCSILTFVLRRSLHWTALIASLWLLSYPERVRQETLGFETMRRISPDPDLWQSIAAVMLVSTVTKMPSIRRVLMSSILQYLGKISFAFYLVHVPVLESVGWRIANTWRVAAQTLQNGKDVGKTTVFLSSTVLSVAAHAFMFAYVLLIVIYFADLVWIYVDKPTMKLLYRLQ
ncbi:hypothetical protein KVR01_013635 [Diaporthe batatas]|uniref:uncharacterized protein n=1 Tax=Diaporthe batatas TaxID=748121 RepID=UPI001D04C26C|nr:uncharacterized protein KVR01_013635 [Diaporthe batatas]KAG8156531.1 hypothetical protein KVR01_013635 [Diaporthe batatas]